jgi:Spy/CpxP family protein refolding chaperone
MCGSDFMNKTTMGLAVILAVILAGTGAELRAQQRSPGARAEARVDRVERMTPRAGAPGVEGVLRMRDRLKLTDDQIARFDALRGERVRERTAVSSEMAELRSQLRAGTLDRAEARERMREVADARRASAAEARAEVESLLTEDQRATLQSQRRAFEAGRRSAMREGARSSRPQRQRPMRDRGRRGPGDAF